MPKVNRVVQASRENGSAEVLEIVTARCPQGTQNIHDFVPLAELQAVIDDFKQVAVRGIDAEAATQEFFAHFPGLAERMEPENPGMHASDTVDYGIALSGEIDLELDDGGVKRLKAGDCYVQNGTRHAWRNPGDVDCVLAAVSVGARTR